MSKGEDKIYTILRRECASHPRSVKNLKKEVIFKDLKYKGTFLRYDFGIELDGKLVLIEFDGMQHFEYVKFFHKNKSTFRHLQENDRRKNRYALKKGIPLFRIPYTDIDSIDSLIDMLRPQYKVKTIYHNDYLRNKNR